MLGLGAGPGILSAYSDGTGNAIVKWLLNRNVHTYSSCTSTTLYNLKNIACNSEAMSALCKAYGKTLPVGNAKKRRLPGY